MSQAVRIKEARGSQVISLLVLIVLALYWQGGMAGSAPAAEKSSADSGVRGASNGSVDELDLEKYLSDDGYVAFDVDIDGDGVLDKVISSAPNSGNELIFFKQGPKGPKKVLTTINLTEDGGRVLDRVSQEFPVPPSKDLMSIRTYFSKEDNSAIYYISFLSGRWMLTRAIYEVSDWRESSAKAYLCEVAQNISMRSLLMDGVRVKQAPEHPAKSRACKEKSAAQDSGVQ
ncbi:hypothetical protein [Pseudomonas panipatensis]|uniref:Uncharacterized protein n=1 Tax=Pseudomonas panipatensis TaxID=428992 RepID=A0A1G8M800_9PSED|nr:hypothetical protein [Pseudomonas panipatensis]SDI64015.1 hypothetical protein SAMN05216272_1143 [Pseudomonas panipatensis]SMP76425.1 hypothetical protein SAMN06295951_1154 [Pseudomonas panipatensis]